MVGGTPDEAAQTFDSENVHADYEKDPLAGLPPKPVRFIAVEPLRRVYEQLEAAD